MPDRAYDGNFPEAPHDRHIAVKSCVVSVAAKVCYRHVS